MARVYARGIAIAAALALTAMFGYPRPIAAQPRSCLHGPDETLEQAARRTRALGVARHINTTEAMVSRSAGSYQPLDQLAQIPIPEGIPQGFVVHLTSDGASYAFSVKDTLDPCAFGYFSDQDGTIYNGRAIF